MPTSENNRIDRRNALVVLGGAAMLPLLPSKALALSTGEASGMIQKLVTEIMRAVNSGQSEARILADFRKLFLRYADIPIIARSVLGAPWRSASSGQQKAFIQAFEIYLANKYGKRFHSYRGSTVTVLGATDQGQKGILVKTTVKASGQAPFTVDYQVSDRSGSNKLFNILIEGISMLSAERSEVRAMLESQRGDVNKLIALLKSS